MEYKPEEKHRGFFSPSGLGQFHWKNIWIQKKYANMKKKKQHNYFSIFLRVCYRYENYSLFLHHVKYLFGYFQKVTFFVPKWIEMPLGVIRVNALRIRHFVKYS